MDRRTLLKGTAVASAAGLVGIHGAQASAAPGPGGITHVTYLGADFRAHRGTVAQATYWDNGSAYGIRVGAGQTGFTVRLDLPDGVTIVEASANIRHSSAVGPTSLRLFAFDAHDAYQVIGQKDVYAVGPELIRTVPLDVTPTVVDNDRWGYILRWNPASLEVTQRDRPDTPDELLWGMRIGYQHGNADGSRP